MKSFFTLFAIFIFVVSTAQNNCIPCIVGKSLKDPDVNNIVYGTLGVKEITRNESTEKDRYDLNNGGYILTRDYSKDILEMQFVATETYGFEELQADYPEFLQGIGAQNGAKLTKSNLPYEILQYENSKKNGSKIYYMVPGDKGALLIGIEWNYETNEWISLLIRNKTYNPTSLALNICQEPCKISCEDKMTALEIDKVAPWDFWKLQVEGYTECEVSYLSKLKNFNITPSPLGGSTKYASKDGSFEFDVWQVFTFSDTRNKGMYSIAFDKINLANYFGEMPFGLSNKISYNDLVNTFGVSYTVNEKTKVLKKLSDLSTSDWIYKVQLGDGLELSFDFKLDDKPQQYAQFVKIKLSGIAYKYADANMDLEDITINKGCLSCEIGDCAKGYKCNYRDVSGEILYVNMKDGEPISGAYTFSESLQIEMDQEQKKAEQELKKKIANLPPCHILLAKLLNDKDPYMVNSYSKVSTLFIQGLTEIKAAVAQGKTNRLSPETQNQMNLAASIFESSYESLNTVLEEAKLKCTCSELNPLYESIELELKRLGKAFFNAETLLKGFVYATGDPSSEAMGFVADAMNGHESKINSFKQQLGQKQCE